MTNTEYLLICIMEEAAEVQQIAAKCLRFGINNHHPERPDITNAEELQRELIDLDAVRFLMIEDGVLPYLHSTIKDMTPKITKVRRYMQVSMDCGTLQPEPEEVMACGVIDSANRVEQEPWKQRIMDSFMKVE